MGAPAWFSSLIAATNSSAPVYSTLSPTLPFVPQEVDPSHGQRGVRRFPGIRFFGVSHGCRVLRHLKQSVVQRVLRQQTVEFLTGQLLIENRKGRVIEPDGLLIIGQQLILLRPQVHRDTQG